MQQVVPTTEIISGSLPDKLTFILYGIYRTVTLKGVTNDAQSLYQDMFYNKYIYITTGNIDDTAFCLFMKMENSIPTYWLVHSAEINYYLKPLNVVRDGTGSLHDLDSYKKANKELEESQGYKGQDFFYEQGNEKKKKLSFLHVMHYFQPSLDTSFPVTIYGVFCVFEDLTRLPLVQFKRLNKLN